MYIGILVSGTLYRDVVDVSLLSELSTFIFLLGEYFVGI